MAAVGIDPAQGFDRTLEAGKVISAWEQSSALVDVENKRERPHTCEH